MRILNFKTFENNDLDGNFPTLEEVKSYFYYFTDEVGTSISNYNVGRTPTKSLVLLIKDCFSGNQEITF